MKNNFKILTVILSGHILFTIWKLLYFLSPELPEKGYFSILSMNEHAWLALVFSLSYSAATAFMIFLTKKWWIIAVYAVLDALAVGFYYLGAPYQIVGVFFAVYTGWLIMSTIFIRETNSLVDLTGKAKDLAKKYKVSESTIRKMLKKK